MDLKIILSAFTAVFFAELADKTQLVGITLSSKSHQPLAVFIGSVVAYAIITAISVFLSASLSQFIKPEYLRFGGGALFIVLGVLMLANKI